MKISAKAEYACKAILELALRWPNQEPVQINVIADRQNIPIKFLTQILLSLKQLGVVDSIRGKSGGYALIKHPAKIKLSDVMKHFEGVSTPDGSVENHIVPITFKEIEDKMLAYMDEITFEGLANRSRTRRETLMFEI